jgi:integrase
MSKPAALRLVSDETPTTLFGSTPKKRAPKHRKFMTEAEVEALAKAATSHRDRVMILVAFRHGLRANELVNLKWDQVNLTTAMMTIFRSKHGRDATHPIPGGELRDLRRLVARDRATQRVRVRQPARCADDHASLRSIGTSCGSGGRNV